MNPDVVWLGILNEPHGLNVLASFEQSSADTMHSIHDAAVSREDDRVGEVAILDEASVVYNVSASQSTRSAVGPVRLVQLPNGGQGHALASQRLRQLHKPIDIPSAEPGW